VSENKSAPEFCSTRVRFAPSPTGFFHIGSARTALFNWLYARHTGGVFILRIEDTDSQRNTPEALQSCLDGLRWMGLDWDEGPEVGGGYGPYFQSQRTDIYKQALQKLQDAGKAYTQDGAVFLKLPGERQHVFDKYKQAEVQKVLSEPVSIHDAIRGLVQHPVETDFVLQRSNGDYGFHFTNVVDDLAMGITHVIRGEDHLTNTARHIRLYEALGAQPPLFAHLPLILNSNGRGKMSKREAGAGLQAHIEGGILAEAFRNFLALLGWNPKDNTEKMPIGELIERFDFDGIQKDGARFDTKKLAALNTTYLRELPLETFTWHASPVLSKAGLITEQTDEDCVQRVLALYQPKARDLPSLPELCGFFFSREYVIDPKVLAKLSKKGDPVERAQELAQGLESLEVWDEASVEARIEALAQAHGRAKFDYFPVARLAVSGQGGGPDLLGTLRVLGQQETLHRLKDFCAS
jgi:glutamyl-tRNA synthetase